MSDVIERLIILPEPWQWVHRDVPHRLIQRIPDSIQPWVQGGLIQVLQGPWHVHVLEIPVLPHCMSELLCQFSLFMNSVHDMTYPEPND